MSQTSTTTGLGRAPVTGTATRARRKRPFLIDLYSTAVGKKYVMAISGIAMMGFVLFHMIGNLKMYQGPEAFDSYAEFLKKLLYPLAPKNSVLWILRGGLVTMLLLHLHAAWSLTRLNRHARAVKYQGPRDYQVVWHLFDFTFGTVNAVGTDGTFVRGEVYANLVRSLDRPVVSAFYIIANILLGIHLFHGSWSIFQSMGWNNPRFNNWRRAFATGFATVVVVGNVSFPIAVIAGIVK
jgi:succinate dehydrogenase / fumarate reductase cytochrome b subunit